MNLNDLCIANLKLVKTGTNLYNSESHSNRKVNIMKALIFGRQSKVLAAVCF